MVHVDLIEYISLSYNICICNSITSLSAVCHVFSSHLFGIALWLHVYQVYIHTWQNWQGQKGLCQSVFIYYSKQKIEDTKEAIESRESKDKQYDGKMKGQLKMCNVNPIKTRGNSRAQEGLTVPVPLVTPVLLLLNNTNIISHLNYVGHQYT